MVIEILNWAVRVATPAEVLAHQPAPKEAGATITGDTRTIICDLTGAARTAAIVPRDRIQPDTYVQGPALIVEPQTTTFVSADFTARVDGAGNLHLTQETQP